MISENIWLMLLQPLFETSSISDRSWLAPDQSGHLSPYGFWESILPVNHMGMQHWERRREEAASKKYSALFCCPSLYSCHILHTAVQSIPDYYYYEDCYQKCN